MIDNYSRVQLLTERHREEGVQRGAVGYVIEVYGNGDYEVEFSHADGSTYALITARTEELCVVEGAAIGTLVSRDS